jgi:hypothetical protein
MAQGTLTASNHASLALGADGNLYALTETGEVATSLDNGATWNTVGTIPVPDAVAIRRWDTALCVLTGTGLTWRSTDAGVTWTAIGTVSQVGMAGLTQLVNEMVAINREGLVARSGDGSSWSWVGSVNQLEVVAVATDTPQAVGVPETPSEAPRVVLAPPAPNPLRSGDVLLVRFELPGENAVGLELFDIHGRRVAARDPEPFTAAGHQAIQWNPGTLASGVYLLRISGRDGIQASRRVIMLR